jgi:hypothetical protein
MKKIILALLCLFMVSASLFADMTRSELQQMYLTFFRGNGITALIDNDGDIQFEYAGKYIDSWTYYIIVDETDQQYFNISSFVISLDTAQEKMQAPFAASMATRDAFVAKIYLDSTGNYVIASAETFLVSPRDFEAVFFKLMDGMEEAIVEFVENM